MRFSDQKPVGLIGRYVNALYKLCVEKNTLEKVVEDFKSLQKIIQTNEEIRLLIFSPTIGKSKQTKSIIEILEKARANRITINFCGLLSKNGRIFILEKIIVAFLREVLRRNGEIKVEAFSTDTLEKSEQDIIKNILSKKIVGKKIDLVNKLDQSLIGGLVIKIGSKMIDNSIKTKLKNLELVMKGEG